MIFKEFTQHSLQDIFLWNIYTWKDKITPTNTSEFHIQTVSGTFISSVGQTQRHTNCMLENVSSYSFMSYLARVTKWAKTTTDAGLWCLCGYYLTLKHVLVLKFPNWTGIWGSYRWMEETLQRFWSAFHSDRLPAHTSWLYILDWKINIQE